MSGAESGTPRDLAAAYALGALDATESRAFEDVLAHDAELAREVAEYREVAALLALAVPVSSSPTDGLRARVLAGAPQRPVAATPLHRPAPQWMPWALAASLLLAAWLGAGRARLGLRIEHAYALLAQRDTLLESRERTLNALLAPGVELFQLTATGDPAPGVQLFWDRKRNTAIIHSFGVKPLPQDRAYQLWFIQDGKPVPSITFRPEDGGHARVESIPMPAGGGVTAAAVTEEPLGGSPQPTSPIYLLAKLSGA